MIYSSFNRHVMKVIQCKYRHKPYNFKYYLLYTTIDSVHIQCLCFFPHLKLSIIDLNADSDHLFTIVDRK